MKHFRILDPAIALAERPPETPTAKAAYRLVNLLHEALGGDAEIHWSIEPPEGAVLMEIRTTPEAVERCRGLVVLPR